jgi:hypothetical protein
MGVVDRGADHARGLEGMGVGLIAPRQPAHQVFNGANGRRRLDRFL